MEVVWSDLWKENSWWYHH